MKGKAPWSLALILAAGSGFSGVRGEGTIYQGRKNGRLLFTNIPSHRHLRPRGTGIPGDPRGERNRNVVRDPYEGIIREAAERTGLREDVLRAVIAVESGFRPGAVSPRGAMGLMQLMPETADALGVSEPFDPRENVLGGARYLRRLLDRFRGDLRMALAAYNAGEKRVREKESIPPYPETRRYVQRIMDRIGAPPRVASRDRSPMKSLFFFVDADGIPHFTDIPREGALSLR